MSRNLYLYVVSARGETVVTEANLSDGFYPNVLRDYFGDGYLDNEIHLMGTSPSKAIENEIISTPSDDNEYTAERDRKELKRYSAIRIGDIDKEIEKLEIKIDNELAAQEDRQNTVANLVINIQGENDFWDRISEIRDYVDKTPAIIEDYENVIVALEKLKTIATYELMKAGFDDVGLNNIDSQFIVWNID